MREREHFEIADNNHGGDDDFRGDDDDDVVAKVVALPEQEFSANFLSDDQR